MGCNTVLTVPAAKALARPDLSPSSHFVDSFRRIGILIFSVHFGKTRMHIEIILLFIFAFASTAMAHRKIETIESRSKLSPVSGSRWKK